MTFAAILFTSIYCESGQPVIDNMCDGKPANKIEMSILTGDGICPDWDCARDVRAIIEIKRDDKIILSIPANAIDQDTLNKLWIAMKPSWSDEIK